MASLSAFRCLFGCVMLVAILRFASKGWLHSQLVAPTFHFTYAAFPYAKVLPAPWLILLVSTLAFSALCIALGVRTRLFSLLFFVGFTYLELIDQTLYLNHYYLVSLLALMLLCLPADGTLSAANWLNPKRSIDTVPAWMLFALRLQVGVVYLYAGVAKLNSDWLLRAQPLRIWLLASGDTPLLGPWLSSEAMAYVASWTSAAFDLTIVGFLLSRRTRHWAFAAVVFFHLLTSALFPIGMFPWIMIAGATLFFEPDWPRRFVWLPRNIPIVHARVPSWIFMLLALHCAVQLTLPLRQFWHPGPSAWTFQGFNFAWNVMVAEKTARVWFDVFDRDDGSSQRVEPRSYLTPAQEHMMAQDPELIRALAQHIAREQQREGREVGVTAHAFATLNGRPMQRMLDPNVDLTRPVANGWILPLKP